MIKEIAQCAYLASYLSSIHRRRQEIESYNRIRYQLKDRFPTDSNCTLIITLGGGVNNHKFDSKPELANIQRLIFNTLQKFGPTTIAPLERNELITDNVVRKPTTWTNAFCEYLMDVLDGNPNLHIVVLAHSNGASAMEQVLNTLEKQFQSDLRTKPLKENRKKLETIRKLKCILLAPSHFLRDDFPLSYLQKQVLSLSNENDPVPQGTMLACAKIVATILPALPTILSTRKVNIDFNGAHLTGWKNKFNSSIARFLNSNV
jgi:hypothetical protein